MSPVHLSETGLHAGRRLCMSSHGTSVHASYAPLDKLLYRQTCCTACLKVWATEAYDEGDEMPGWVITIRSNSVDR